MTENDSQDAEAGLDALLAQLEAERPVTEAFLAQLEAERPAFEAWLAEQMEQAQRELDELLATLAADTTLDELLAELAALEAPDVGQT